MIIESLVTSPKQESPTHRLGFLSSESFSVDVADTARTRHRQRGLQGGLQGSHPQLTPLRMRLVDFNLNGNKGMFISVEARDFISKD